MFGDGEAARRDLSVILDGSAAGADRQRAIRRLAVQQRKELASALPTLLDTPELRVEAVRAVAAFDVPALGETLLARYASWTSDGRRGGVSALASRPAYGWQLTRAIASGAVPRRDVPPHLARQLLRVVGSGFIEVWGPVEDSVNDARAYSRYRRMLTGEALQS